jgi:dihydropteroate synthase
MGVLNVTPDSFSDGGAYLDADRAIEHGLRLFAEGADIVDVGGESTRPGAAPVEPAVEQARVLPVVAELAGHGRVSIDTRHRSTAEAALAAGATIVNDLGATLWPVCAEAGAGWIAVHVQGEPATMQDDPRYDDVVGEVHAFLLERAEAAREAGVDEVWIDPGLGFGKTFAHNLALVAHLDALVATGVPVCIGASRKGFLGRLVAASDAERATLPGLAAPATDATVPVPVAERLEASLTVATWAISQGVQLVRVHDVRPTVHAVALVGAP